MNEKLFKQYLEYEIKEDVPKYVKSRIIPKYADDYPYSFKWDERYGNLTEGDQKYERVRNVKDLVQSQIAHYKT